MYQRQLCHLRLTEAIITSKEKLMEAMKRSRKKLIEAMMNNEELIGAMKMRRKLRADSPAMS